MKKTPNLWSRLGGFAAIHFALSLLSIAVATGMSAGLIYHNNAPSILGLVYFLLGLLPMALYFPLGMFMGAVAPWSRVRTLRELGASVLLQAGIGWAWAGAIHMMIYFPSTYGWLAFLSLPTLVLVAPSLLFALCMLALIPSASSLTIEAAEAALVFLIFLAGLLPPLLYNLGNLLMARRRLKKAAATAPEIPKSQEKADSHK